MTNRIANGDWKQSALADFYDRLFSEHDGKLSVMACSRLEWIDEMIVQSGGQFLAIQQIIGGEIEYVVFTDATHLVSVEPLRRSTAAALAAAAVRGCCGIVTSRGWHHSSSMEAA